MARRGRPAATTEFMVCGKQVVIVRGEAAAARTPSRRWSTVQTSTRISCPPRSLRGPGAAAIQTSDEYRALLELETMSCGGRLQALSGASVWRTMDDFGRLVRYVSRAAFEDGRPVRSVFPELEYPINMALRPLLRVSGDDGTDVPIQVSLLDEIREYVRSLIGAAERNELPVCVLHCLLSFLGSPPGRRGRRDGSTSRCRRRDGADEPADSPMDVWLTMSRLGELPFDTGRTGRARKRHHTVGGRPSARAPAPRRSRSAPADPRRCLLTRLELSVLPAAADHPLDRHMAARTVRFCCQPPAVDWHGSGWTQRWRRELARQARLRHRRLLHGLAPRLPLRACEHGAEEDDDDLDGSEAEDDDGESVSEASKLVPAQKQPTSSRQQKETPSKEGQQPSAGQKRPSNKQPAQQSTVQKDAQSPSQAGPPSKRDKDGTSSAGERKQPASQGRQPSPDKGRTEESRQKSQPASQQKAKSAPAREQQSKTTASAAPKAKLTLQEQRTALFQRLEPTLQLAKKTPEQGAKRTPEQGTKRTPQQGARRTGPQQRAQSPPPRRRRAGAPRPSPLLRSYPASQVARVPVWRRLARWWRSERRSERRPPLLRRLARWWGFGEAEELPVERAIEATEARVQGILRRQRTLPVMFRMLDRPM